MRIGLALGGGGARGFFHVGVIKALEKMDLKPAVIAGTSMGAIVGGVYALTGSAAETEKSLFRVLQTFSRELAAMKSFLPNTAKNQHKQFFEDSLNFFRDFVLWNLHILKNHLLDPRPFIRIFRDLFGDHEFRECGIPFYAASVDLASGEKVIFSEGPLYRAIMASISIPGFFPPMNMEGRALVDGGVLMPLPVEIIKDEDTFVMGVNLESTQYKMPMLKNAMDILTASDLVRYRYILETNLEMADFVLEPNLEDFVWLDFDRARDLVKFGEAFALSQEENIRKAIAGEGKIKRVLGFIKNKVSFFTSKLRKEIVHESDFKYMRSDSSESR